MVATERAELVCRLGRAMGFERVGIAPAGRVKRAEFFEQWLGRGWAGEMEYLGRWRELRVDPRRVLEGAKSVIVVAQVYGHAEGFRVQGSGFSGRGSDGEKERRRDEGIDSRGVESAKVRMWESEKGELRNRQMRGRGDAETERWREGGTEGQRDGGTEGRGEGGGERQEENGDRFENRNPKSEMGRVAQYAWGRDYHRVLRKKLRRLVDALRVEMAEEFAARICVDTAPVLERELAAEAGVGWIGKNTLVMHEDLGSFFFLGEVITTLELAPSAPAVDRCGTCTRCLEACPTGALVAPYQMDARRCISYLTIEQRSEIPAELRCQMGEWLYGCDICQEVCPHNHKAQATTEPAYAAGKNPLAPRADLRAVVEMDEEDYREALAGSAMKRASLEMLKRNARAVMGE